ncbi:MAG: hypothetical protein ACJ78Q_13130 [Chloroflexia bacterium]
MMILGTHTRMALFWPSRPVRPPTEQVQCPNCGGPRANVQLELHDTETGKPVRQGMGVAALVGILTFFVAGNIARSLFGSTDPVLFLCLTVGVTATALFGTAFWLTQRQTRAVRVHKYRCLTCGHEWSRHEGTPMPHANETRPENHATQ